jgi:hypothetical protein
MLKGLARVRTKTTAEMIRKRRIGRRAKRPRRA